MKKRLLLITCGFPYGESERGFLPEEVKQLTDTFDVSVLALDIKQELIHPTYGLKRIERYHVPTFRKSISFDLLRDILRISTLRELWNCGKKQGFRNFSQILVDIIYFRFKAWEVKKKARELIVSEKIDIVYAYWAIESALAAVDLKKEFPDLKVIVRFHGMDLYEERTDINWQPFRPEICRGADCLCFACTYGRAYFTMRWGSDYKKKMILSYLGSADRGVLEPRESNRLQILSCSNLVPLKRVELIIKGLACLPKTMEISWTIFGDGPEREKLEKLAKEEFQSCPNIIWKFRGFVPNAALTEEYRKISPDIFITTSSTEGGAPVSIQEVFSMGIPAIGTPVGGIPDLILDGKTGFLLPEQTEPDHVAQAVTRFAALTVQQKQQMRKSVRLHWAKNFDAVKNARRFAAYLENLIEETSEPNDKSIH